MSIYKHACLLTYYYKYRKEIKNSALLVFPQVQIIILNYVCSVSPVWCMNSTMGKPSWGRLCVRIDHPYPASTPYHRTGVHMVRTPPPLLFGGMVGLFNRSFEQGFFITQNHCHMDLWWVWLILTRTHLHWQHLPLHQTQRERVSWLLFGRSLCLFSVSFSGSLELFSNSHLSIICLNHENIAFEFILCSHRPASYLTITRIIWSEQTRAWWPFELVWDSWPPISRTRIPCQIILRPFWFEWTRTRWSPLALQDWLYMHCLLSILFIVPYSHCLIA